MHRLVATTVMTALTAVAAGCGQSVSPAPTPTSAPPPPSNSGAGPAGTREVAGPVEDMRWGPVQVTITVRGRRITDVGAELPMDRARSAFINQQAGPLLRSEVLQAQSANIDLLSGATMTSEAYVLSLQGALSKV